MPVKRPGKKAERDAIERIIQFTMRRAPVIVLDNGASSIKVGVTTSPKVVR
jgi:hypothetical protein